MQSRWPLVNFYGFSAIGDVIRGPAPLGREDARRLYAHFASAILTKDAWTFEVYAKNAALSTR
jgi:hypothetical protein